MPSRRKRTELKVPLGIDVLTAARQRIALVFDRFPRIYVSFSGGKDSTAMLHLVMDEAIRRGRKVGLLFVDWEAQMQLTIEYVAECFVRYADHIEPAWCALPLTTVNACSMAEPEWFCWKKSKRVLWARALPQQANYTRENPPDFYRRNMTFEEFVPEFAHWFGGDQLTAAFIGIRAAESLNRFRTLRMKKSKFQDQPWTTWLGMHAYNVYPIYDWETEDVWTYLGKYRHPYNRLYDRMHQAGLSIHQMRICEPYGDEQRRGLWLYHLVEPETWGRVVARVAGANSAAIYAGERGNVLGNHHVTLPAGHTWESFAHYLLESMPPKTADHYRDKIATYLAYCRYKIGCGVPDEQPGDCGGKDIPSWRRICKTLLRNDYWCKGLSFSPNKASAYEAYKRLMKKRRAAWGLYT